MKKYLYILVRADLPTREDIMVQAAHAAHWAGIEFGHASKDAHFAILSVPDEPTLLEYIKDLEWIGFRTVEFRETDLKNQITAAAFEPISGEQRLMFAALKSFKFSA